MAAGLGRAAMAFALHVRSARIFQGFHQAERRLRLFFPYKPARINPPVFTRPVFTRPVFTLPVITRPVFSLPLVFMDSASLADF